MKETQFHAWKPIQELLDDRSELADGELRALETVWHEQRQQLQDNGSLETFTQRLQREWAIETGIIERLYSLDRGVTQLLIERGIQASYIPSDNADDPRLVAAMIKDHEDVVEGLFSFVKSDRGLTTSYIKELHAALTRSQQSCAAVDALGRQVEVPLVRGEYKTLPNNPIRPDGRIHEYCPPEQTASEMDRLVELYRRYEDEEVHAEILSAWLHHRFTQIHPFQDGNGRVARALASVVFIRRGWFPLTVNRDDREEYIGALEHADEGDLQPLVQQFSTIQRRTFVQALGIAGDVRRSAGVDQLIGAVRDLLERRQEDLQHKWDQAKQTADKLREYSAERLGDLSSRLENELGSYGAYSFRVDAEDNGGERRHYFREQVVSTARELQYWANLTSYHGWARLVIQSGDQSEILISFHGVGQEFRGLIAATVSFFQRVETEDGQRQVTPAQPSSGLFQINYQESFAATRTRFEPWLEGALLRSLEMWRKGL